MFPVAAVLLVLDRTGRAWAGRGGGRRHHPAGGGDRAGAGRPAGPDRPAAGRPGRQPGAAGGQPARHPGRRRARPRLDAAGPGRPGRAGPARWATGGYTSTIPLLVPERLLARANALEASSFNIPPLSPARRSPAVAVTAAAQPGRCWPRRPYAGLALRRPSLPCPGSWPPWPATTRPRWPTAILPGHAGTWPAHVPVLRGVTVATAAGSMGAPACSPWPCRFLGPARWGRPGRRRLPVGRPWRRGRTPAFPGRRPAGRRPGRRSGWCWPGSACSGWA